MKGVSVLVLVLAAAVAVSGSAPSSFTRAVTGKHQSIMEGGIVSDTAYCGNSLICNLGCPRADPECCSGDYCYYSNFWVNWSCCGGSGNDGASCCGKLTSGAIGIIVFITICIVASIAACIYCCCCKNRAVPVMVPAATTYVLMPGQAQPQPQTIAYGQPIYGGQQQPPQYAPYMPPPTTNTTGYQQFQNPNNTR